MKGRVELIYDVDCPNISAAREALLQAFARVGVSVSWLEWDRTSPENPGRVGGCGSPTILVDGKDVAGAKPGTWGESCRLYCDEASGFRGAPAVDQIVATLRTGYRPQPRLDSVASRRVVPGVGASLLSVATGPACWLISTRLHTDAWVRQAPTGGCCQACAPQEPLDKPLNT